MNRFDNRKKSSIILTLLFVIMSFVIVLYGNYNNNYSLTLNGSFFETDKTEGIVLDKDEWNTIHVKNESDEVVTLRSQSLILSEGNYNIDFQYACDEDSNAEFYFVSPSSITEENKDTGAFTKVNLDSLQDSQNIDVEIKEPVWDAYFAVEIPANSGFRLGRVTMQSDTVKAENVLVYVGILFLAYLFIMFMLWKKKPLSRPFTFRNEEVSGRKVSFIILIILLSSAFFLTGPLFSKELLGCHDTVFHLSRIEGMAESLKSGQFPIRIHSVLLNGYGYPNSIFYPELFLYIPAAVRALGLSLKNSYVVLIFFINLLTVFAAYMSFSKLFENRFVGMFTALVYAMSPYRLVSIYQRAAIGRVLAMSFLPVVFYGMYAVFCKDKKDWKYLTLGVCGLLQSHILTTEIMAFLCALFAIFSIKKLFTKEKRWLTVAKSLIYALLLNSWFLIPFLISFLRMDISVAARNPKIGRYAITNISNLFKIIDLNPIKDNKRVFTPNGMNIMLVLAVVAFLVILLLTKKNEKNKNLISIGSLCCAAAVVLSLMVTDIFPWDFVQSNFIISKIVGTLQFPFRLLGVINLLLAILIGVDLLLICKNSKEIFNVSMSLGLVMILIANIQMDIMNIPTLERGSFDKCRVDIKVSGRCIGQGEYISSSSSLLDILGRGPLIKPVNGNIKFSNLDRKGLNYTFDYSIEDYDNETEYGVIMPLTYYPHFIAEIDGIKYDTYATGVNYVGFNLPTESGNVKLYYQQPTLFILANILTVISVVIFLLDDKITNLIFKKRK